MIKNAGMTLVARSPTIQAALLLAVASALSTIVWLKVPYSAPVTGGHLRVLEDLVQGRMVAYTPYSVGYLYFAALLIRVGGMSGLFLGNAFVYAATVLFAYATLRSLGLQRAAFVGAMAVAFYPHLFLNVKKLLDTGFSAFLLVLFAFFLIRAKNGLNVKRALGGSLLFTAILLARPNCVLLVPLAIFAAIQGHKFGRREVLLLVPAVLLTIGMLMAIVVPLKGRFVVFDRYYAACAFFHGTHRHAFDGILRDYNGEWAAPKTMLELGIPFASLDEVVPGMDETYFRLGWEYVKESPLRYVALLGLKLVNLFRPDFRNIYHSRLVPVPVFVLAKLAIAGIFPAWFFLQWKCRQFLKLSDGFMVVPFLLLYVLPFVLTNSDARYRIPFDPIFIMSIAWCLVILKSRSKSTGNLHKMEGGSVRENGG